MKRFEFTSFEIGQSVYHSSMIFEECDARS